jgi:GTPase
MGKLPTIAIVGKPNVGKSTLFNRIVRKRIAVVEDEPGVTRDRLYADCEWQGKRFTLVDTGGLVFQETDPLIEQIQVQAQIAMDEADVILFLVDGADGLTPDDRDLADRLRGVKKPIFLLVNKADHPNRDQFAHDFYGLGMGEPWPVSGLHGRGIGDLLDEVVPKIPEVTGEDEEIEEIRLAIVGRPNVGKSSLVNAFTGEQRMIVSDIAGTTRDAIDTTLEYRNEQFRLIDTAGIRRRGKIQGTVEYYMVNRAQKAIERADCALVVVDGGEGLTDGDKRIAKIAHDAGKACIFAINKWDTKEPPDGRPRQKSQEKKHFLRTLHDEIPELGYAPAAFTSAIESAGLEPVLDLAMNAVENFSFRISTGQLNRIIHDATFARPYTTKGRALKIYYATQVTTRPPTFVLFCNDPELMHFSYQRYLLNKIRAQYPLEGTPIRLFARASRGEKP